MSHKGSIIHGFNLSYVTPKRISRFSGEKDAFPEERIEEQGRTREVKLKDFSAQKLEKAGPSSLKGRWDDSDPWFVFKFCPWSYF